MSEHDPTLPSPRNCPRCGGPMLPEKPCPNCLLQMVSQPTGEIDAVLDELSLPVETTDLSPAEHPKKSKSPEPGLEQIRAVFSETQPHLEILEKIGRGGMGTVFKARQKNLDRFVALKILSTELAERPTFSDRFAREGKLLARLSHPNIVSVYDYGQAGEFYYLILEYIEGVNLREAMRERQFSPEQALSIVPKICEALQYAHEEGVLHRDIKPENILLDVRGRIKITDFGIGKWADQNDSFQARNAGEDISETPPLTDLGQILGTPNYMAPEQVEDPNTVDHRADIYSLGVVFYELLTGELPKGRFPLPSEKKPVDEQVDQIVLKALEKEREKRFQSAGEMQTSIETAAKPKSKIQTGSRLPFLPLGFVLISLVLCGLGMGLIVPQRLGLIPLESELARAEADLELFQKITAENQRKFENLDRRDPEDPKELVLQAKIAVDSRWERDKENVLREAQGALDAKKRGIRRDLLGFGAACGYAAVIPAVLGFALAVRCLRKLREISEKPGLFSSSLVVFLGIPVVLITLGFSVYFTVCAKEMF